MRQQSDRIGLTKAAPVFGNPNALKGLAMRGITAFVFSKCRK